MSAPQQGTSNTRHAGPDSRLVKQQAGFVAPVRHRLPYGLVGHVLIIKLPRDLASHRPQVGALSCCFSESGYGSAFIEEISQRSRSSSPAARVKPHPPGGSGDPPHPPYKQEKHHLDKRVESLIAVAAAADDEDLLDTNAVAKWIGTTPQWLSIGRTYRPAFFRSIAQLR